MWVNTEYSFRKVYGPIDAVVAKLPEYGGIIADDGCWGHVPFARECAKQGKHGVLGCRFPGPVIAVPTTPGALQEVYRAVAEGLDPERARVEGVVLISLGAQRATGAAQGYSPGVNRRSSTTVYASSDNLYPTPGDRQIWELMLGRLARGRSGPGHILSPKELVLEGALPEEVQALRGLIESADTPLPRAENIKFPVADVNKALADLCWEEMRRRELYDERYPKRLEYELNLIADKKFADYFLVIADMMQYAKTQMLVGPARGSSAGSLVCWLTRITEIDPIKHDLIFERFIDVNRHDLPDIDIDFPDTSREKIIAYLGGKYGQANVAHIGTVIRYKPKSALTDIAKQANVPLYELDKLKDVIIERSSGDSRAFSCLEDSFTGLEIGRQLAEKYPLLRMASRIENHARSAGVHAAGIIVCNAPVSNYCGVKDGEAQLDKKSAEAINMLKIDALGLRTLSVVEETCRLAGIEPQSLYNLPLDDQRAFDTLNAHQFSGIFQFEGIALQSVAKQVNINCFEDIACITALARPGPLAGGETTRWVEGKKKGAGAPLHPALEKYTQETYGTIIYQEQVMVITRELGGFSWADTAKIRKLMSDRKGQESFQYFQSQFLAGAQGNGISAMDSQRIWESINSFGCLSGDSWIELPAANQHTPKKIQLKRLFANGGLGKVAGTKSNRKLQAGRKAKIWNVNESTGVIKPAKLIDVTESGVKLTWKLKLSGGKSIRATADHRFMTRTRGWQRMDLLQEGELVAVLGGKRPGKKFKGVGSGAHNEWHGQSKLFAQRVKVLQKKFKLCQKCKRRPYQETHHLDKNRRNNEWSNLLPVCRKCHKSFHVAEKGISYSRGNQIAWLEVVSRSELKQEMTYDIAMPSPNNNFVANGIVVHNSWAFNKSHAVAYGILSYWTAWLKAVHPIAFSVANLRGAKDEESAMALLREIMREGKTQFVPVSIEHSTDKWEQADGVLTGPLTGLPGIGLKKAADIIIRRQNNIPLTPGQVKLLAGKSKFEDYAPCRKMWGHLYDHPEKYFRTVKRVDEAEECNPGDKTQQFVVLGKLVKKNQRSLNEERYVERRKGKIMPPGRDMMLLFHLEDDSGRMLCCVSADKYARIGAPMVERAALGTWFCVRGVIQGDFKMLMVSHVEWLSEDPKWQK